MNTSVGYDVYQDHIALSLMQQLSKKDTRQLHATLQTLGFSGWWDWQIENVELVVKHWLGSPAQRKRLSLTQTERRLAIYGGVVLAQLGAALGPRFDDPAICLPNDSVDRRSARGALVWAANQAPWELWPFGDENEKPFS